MSEQHRQPYRGRFCPAPPAWLQPLQSAGICTAALGALALGRAFGRRRSGQFAILMYHRCSPRIPGIPAPTINVTPRRLRHQLEGLLRRGYQFWPLRRVLDESAAGAEIPDNVIVVTFDDGFESVYVYAARILRDLGIPATFFINTAYLGSDAPFPFDHWGCRYHRSAPPVSYRPLTVEHCAELHDEPLFEIGAHTHTHQDFRDRPSELYRDLERNVQELREQFGIEQPSFAFPYGTPHLGFADACLIAAARATGVVCGLTTASRLVDPRQDPFTWGRLNVFAWDTSATLDARVRGWYSWAPRQRQRLVRLVRGRRARAPGGSAPIPTGAPVALTAGVERTDARRLISVVIPTFNRAAWLTGAVESLLEQQTDGQFDYEIIVVDNQSTDNTAEVVENLRARSSIPIHYVLQPKPGDAPTRNAGIQRARGSWIAFFDDDQFADRRWLAELYQAAWASGALVIGGPVHLDLDPAMLEYLGPICRRALREVDYYRVLHPYGPRQLPGTGNALVARRLFDSVGLFDESMRTGGSDSDFFKRVRQAGHELWYAPRAIIRHRIPAERLTPEYLRWDALSGGAGHAAHFDLRERGRAALLVLCAARLAKAGLIILPRYVWARWRGREGHALGQRTLLWRTEGYLRKTLAVIAPRCFPQTEFFASLDFRNGRSFAAPASAATAAEMISARPEGVIE